MISPINGFSLILKVGCNIQRLSVALIYKRKINCYIQRAVFFIIKFLRHQVEYMFIVHVYFVIIPHQHPAHGRLHVNMRVRGGLCLGIEFVIPAHSAFQRPSRKFAQEHGTNGKVRAIGQAFLYLELFTLIRHILINTIAHLGILVGARLGHCLFYEPGYYLSHPIEMLLPIRDTPTGWQFTGYQGLASHGGAVGLIIALWLYVRRTRLNFVDVLDFIAIVTPLTACFIRLGNLMNGEIVGKPTDVPWAFLFDGYDEPRHPAQLYEALAYFAFFLIMVWLYRRGRKQRDQIKNPCPSVLPGNPAVKFLKIFRGYQLGVLAFNQKPQRACVCLVRLHLFVRRKSL